ncbi:hypothetical protein [Pseudacidovorax sp. NFM-22]|uniref:hypothetical protein n=1 Tax=Pseudacidovorax sp. NFM-22 TaxID=2744469 RepID=UPI001F2A6DF8|nr:hypothetical protein [Pseudacidovorax sp. NFM-22]
MNTLAKKFKRAASVLIAIYISAASAEIIGAKISGNRIKIETDTAGTSISIDARGTIWGYEVNCNKSKLVAWGVPDELNYNAPQIGFVTIVDSKSPLAAKRKILGQGVMDVQFMKNRNYALLVSDSAVIINLDNGKIQYVPSEENLDNFSHEECRKAGWQTFRKY